MRFSPRKFNNMINNVAQNVSWRKAYACPCVNPQSSAADPECRHCGGKGNIWDDAVDGTAALTERDTLRQWKEFGQMDAGDLVLVLASDSALYEIGRSDRVVMQDRTEPFSINLLSGRRDQLRLPVVSIDRLFWLLPNGDISDGEIPKILDNGIIEHEFPPPIGTTYSVTGRQHPEYFVWMSLPTDRPHHKGSRLPRRVVLRKWDLYGR
ncbi:MAG: hypothetical protein HN842_05230 [Gammaproteobacteria bacterium]|jgi:hypothetical protein|nr:hypothetical protein [Gammaproteobacteria bacterium]MBT7307598.1 hypothetical protein [Gammaproteobacteria bacterium]